METATATCTTYEAQLWDPVIGGWIEGYDRDTRAEALVDVARLQRDYPGLPVRLVTTTTEEWN